MKHNFIVSEKVYVNLSNKACDVIYSDMQTFNMQFKNNISGFLNLIFKNYYEKSSATLNLFQETETNKFIKLSQNSSFTNLNKNDIIKLANAYGIASKNEKIKEIKKILQNKGKGITISLNKENRSILSGENNIYEIKEANNYCGSLAGYLKALFEDYACLPAYEREKVFLNDKIEIINRAIKYKQALKIELENKNTFLFKPYKILTSEYTYYNYLIGLSKRISDDDSKFINASIRLNRITKIRQVERSGFISKDNKILLEKDLRTKGCMFLIGSTQCIKVKLTKNGQKQYKDFAFLRPQYIDIENDDIYVFDATPAQILFYFFKYGEDAIILEPAYLREKFISKYKNALNNYDDTSHNIN